MTQQEIEAILKEQYGETAMAEFAKILVTKMELQRGQVSLVKKYAWRKPDGSISRSWRKPESALDPYAMKIFKDMGWELVSTLEVG